PSRPATVATGAGDSASAPTAASNSARTRCAGRRSTALPAVCPAAPSSSCPFSSVKRATCAGLATSALPSAVDMPSTASNRARAPSSDSARASSGPSPATSAASARRSSVSSARSGSAARPSESSSGTPGAGATSPASAGSWRRASATDASAKPRRRRAAVRETCRVIASQRGDEPLELVPRHLVPVLLELGALVPQEELERVFSEGLGDELRTLHDLDGLTQRGRQGLDAQRATFGPGHRRDVLGGSLGEVVVAFDPLQPGVEQDGEGQVWVGRRVQRPVLHPC